jgi:hypothetical protein
MLIRWRLQAEELGRWPKITHTGQQNTVGELELTYRQSKRTRSIEVHTHMLSEEKEIVGRRKISLTPGLRNMI